MAEFVLERKEFPVIGGGDVSLREEYVEKVEKWLEDENDEDDVRFEEEPNLSLLSKLS